MGAKSIGLSVYDALWNYPLSAILQMIHAAGVANGNDYDWVYAGEPSKEILERFKQMEEINIEELLE